MNRQATDDHYDWQAIDRQLNHDAIMDALSYYHHINPHTAHEQAHPACNDIRAYCRRMMAALRLFTTDDDELNSYLTDMVDHQFHMAESALSDTNLLVTLRAHRQLLTRISYFALRHKLDDGQCSRLLTQLEICTPPDERHRQSIFFIIDILTTCYETQSALIHSSRLLRMRDCTNLIHTLHIAENKSLQAGYLAQLQCAMNWLDAFERRLSWAMVNADITHPWLDAANENISKSCSHLQTTGHNRGRMS